jgi:hypothetical protein
LAREDDPALRGALSARPVKNGMSVIRK